MRFLVNGSKNDREGRFDSRALGTLECHAGCEGRGTPGHAPVPPSSPLQTLAILHRPRPKAPSENFDFMRDRWSNRRTDRLSDDVVLILTPVDVDSCVADFSRGPAGQAAFCQECLQAMPAIVAVAA